MFYSDIPEDENEFIIESAKLGTSPEAIAHLLRDNGCSATAGQVRARLRFLELPITEEPVDLEREVWASLSANLSDLSEIEGRLRDLDEVAFKAGKAMPRPLRVAMTQKNLTTRAQLILGKHKLLQLALTERVKRRLLEAQLPPEARVPPVPPPPPTLPAPPPPPAALPEPLPLPQLAAAFPALDTVPEPLLREPAASPTTEPLPH